MAKRHKAFIGGSWRCGSTALNLSLIQHPSISGWREEHSNFNEVPSDWDGERWVLYKDPQASLRIGAVVARMQVDRVILMLRNPYAIVHSMISYPVNGRLDWACWRVPHYYAFLLEEETKHRNLFFRAKYEDIAMNPMDALTDLLEKVFKLPFDDKCINWQLKEDDIRWGYGDPKVCKTMGWEAWRSDEWRTRLSHIRKDYIRRRCGDLFRSLGYDPDDTEPKDGSMA
jgi:hypothetical protein